MNSRCDSYVNAEPYTLKWLETLTDDSILYDIGSNIGGFSFIATNLWPNMKIYSFEPNICNFYTQRLTTLINNYKNIYALNFALNNKNCFDKFLYSQGDLRAGSNGTFENELKNEMSKSYYANPYKNGTSGTLGTYSVTLDHCIYNMGFPIPDYIKLDVDGNELLILQGAEKLLKEKKFKKLIIEIDNKIESNKKIYEILKENNFILKEENKENGNLVMNCYERMNF